MLKRATLPTAPATPEAGRPGTDGLPSSYDPDRYRFEVGPSAQLDTVAPVQLEPVPGVVARPAIFRDYHAAHAEVTLPRQANNGGHVKIVKRQGTPDGQQTGAIGAPASPVARGPVPNWTDPYVQQF